MASKDLYDKDLYKVLGVSKGDDATAVRKAYRKLAKDFHPDKTKGDKRLEEKFKEVSEAYEILSDEKKRSEYDEMRVLRSRERTPRPDSRGGTPFGFSNSGSMDDDLFETFFRGNPGPRQSARKGSDLLAEIFISFRESLTGKDMSFEINGEKVSTRIPAGIQDGSKVKVRGRGSSGAAGPGDLIILVQVNPHPVFKRKDNDLLMTLPVTFAELTLGADIFIPTFDGDDIRIRVPAGTKNGKTLRVKDRGVKQNEHRGDLLIKVEVQVPQRLNANAKEALKHFASIDNEESPRKHLKSEVQK